MTTTAPLLTAVSPRPRSTPGSPPWPSGSVSKLAHLLEWEYLETQKAHLKRRNRLKSLYPDEGPLRRALYRKHLAFFAAGRDHQERCMMEANRVGKTFAGGYETALHLTGRYSDWWEGRRFVGPIEAWAVGD